MTSSRPRHMVHPERGTVIRLLAGALLLAGACGGERRGDAPPPADEVITPSPTPRVKLKGSDRLRNDLSRALGLAPEDVCNELGQYSCTHMVHRVALGGSAPYDLGLFSPLPHTSLTTPIAAERVALAACVTRVDRDLGDNSNDDQNPEAPIFAALDIDAGGRLDADAGAVAAAVDTLYERAVQRRARPTEIAHLRQLYRDIEARGSERPARDWAVLSCFAVMTTMEHLFY